MQNLIGGDGASLLAPSHKSTRASCGRFRFLPMPSSMQVMMANPMISIAPRLAWSLPTRSAVKTATCPISACGPTTPRPWPKNTVFQRPMWTALPRRCWKGRHEWTKTPCLGNWPMSFQDGLPTCLICKGRTTQWMLPAPPRWRPFSMPVGCFKRAKSTSCWRGQRTERWTLQRLQNSLLLGRFPRRTPRPLMLEPTALSWVKALACWCSSALAMPFVMTMKFTASSEALAAHPTAEAKASPLRANGGKSKPSPVLTTKRATLHLRLNWWKPTGPQPRWATRQNFPPFPGYGRGLKALET